MDDADSPNIFDQLEAAYGSRKHKAAAVRQVAAKVKSSAPVRSRLWQP